jgi:superfamily II DNA/RNA helicase
MMQNDLNIAQILQKLNITTLNLMQEAAYKAISAENDVFLLSPTGSGKTIAFLLPILQLLNNDIPNVQCIIISPTRELAIQIESVWKKMATGLKINACYGGHDMGVEIQNLTNPPAILVGTPGRLSDHIERKTFSTENVTILILDEFDKSLSMGFEEEMSYVVENLKSLKKRILVSATAKVKIPNFMGEINHKVLNFNLEDEKTTDQLKLQTVYSESKDKVDRLFELLCFIGGESTLIFCNHREATERTVALLKEKGIESIAFFHGGMEQLDRERALIQFRNGTITFLVATDLAARGLDIPEVKHVIHFHFPLKKEEFIHRNGRTARMNADGTAYLLLYVAEPNPEYLGNLPEVLQFKTNEIIPNPSSWVTIYISGGRKNKLNKVDIVGFLSKKGGLEKDDLGIIEVMDFMSFAAIKKLKINELMENIKGQKMKGDKYKIEVAR